MVNTLVKEIFDKKNQEINIKLNELDILYGNTNKEFKKLKRRLRIWYWRPAGKLNVNGQQIKISDLAASKMNELESEFKLFQEDYNSKRKELKILYGLVEEEITAKVKSDIIPELDNIGKQIDGLITEINSKVVDSELENSYNSNTLEGDLVSTSQYVEQNLKLLNEFNKHYGGIFKGRKREIRNLVNKKYSELQTALNNYTEKAIGLILNKNLQDLQARINKFISDLGKDEAKNFTQFKQLYSDGISLLDEEKIRFKSGLFGFKNYGSQKNNGRNPFSKFFDIHIGKNGKVRQEILTEIDTLEERFYIYVFDYYEFRINHVLIRMSQLNALFRDGRLNVNEYNQRFAKNNELYRLLYSQILNNISLVGEAKGNVEIVEGIIPEKIRRKSGLIK